MRLLGTLLVAALATIGGHMRDHPADQPVDVEAQAQQSVAAPTACNVPCGPNATCTTKGKTSSCTCNSGYEGAACTDINECATRNGGCPTNSTCTNTPGSFSCACNAGYMMVNKQCRLSTAPSCSVNNGGCSPNATCSSPSGTVVCTCNAGYSGNGVNCTDNNECTLNTDNCDPNATCTNTAGSFSCACNGGFSGNGVSCTDNNECTLNTDNCDPNATCTNTAGSFSCACNGGFSGNGVSCTDNNECTLNTDNCDPNATCTNTAGSFSCACNAPYTGNGITCTQPPTENTKPSILNISGIPAVVDSSTGAFTFPVSVMASDNQSGVKKITVALKAVENVFTRFTPAMCTITASQPYGLSFTGTCSITVAANLLGTTYAVWASVEDGSGNIQTYQDSHYLFFPELEIDNIADNSLVSITTAGDGLEPDLDFIHGVPLVIDVSDVDAFGYNLHLNVKATDDGSGVREVYISFIPRSLDAAVGYCYAGDPGILLPDVIPANPLTLVHYCDLTWHATTPAAVYDMVVTVNDYSFNAHTYPAGTVTVADNQQITVQSNVPPCLVPACGQGGLGVTRERLLQSVNGVPTNLDVVTNSFQPVHLNLQAFDARVTSRSTTSASSPRTTLVDPRSFEHPARTGVMTTGSELARTRAQSSLKNGNEMRDPIRKSSIGLALAGLLLTQPAAAQDSSNSELKKEIQGLSDAVRAVQKDVQELKALLLQRGGAPPAAQSVVLDLANHPFKGKANARLTMVEFSDFQCPFCERHVRETDAQLAKEYLDNGKLKLVYMDFPLEAIHTFAFKAAETARCAGEQGKFWEMQDRLFGSQKTPTDFSNWTAHAAALGLKMPEFESCLNSGKYASEIRKDVVQGQAAGVTGTPGFFLAVTDPGSTNVKTLGFINGAQPYSAFKAQIDALLTEDTARKNP